MFTRHEFFQTTQTSNISPQSKCLHVARCSGPSFWELTTISSFLSQGKLNQADGLSRHPDYKEGIASKNVEQVLLDPGKFLLKPEQFHI